MSKYILALQNSKKKLKIMVNNKNYFIYADTTKEVFSTPNNDFKLKEKLYILNYPLEVVWVPIFDLEYNFLRAFYYFIKPKHLVIRPVNSKVDISVNKFL